MDIKLSSILGNGQKLDGGAMFGNVPRAVWKKWMPPDELGRITLACRALLVEIGDRKILCETGIGDFFSPKLKERFGVEGEGPVLLQNLNAAGFQEDEITDVVLSHLHFDHAGGMLSSYDEAKGDQQEYKLLFPNATLFVGKTAWERAISPHQRDRASFIPQLEKLLQDSGRLLIVEGESCPELPHEFSFHYTGGHTPGHMHTVISGFASEARVFFAGDLIPGVPWVHVPVTMGYDRFPEQLIDEKQEVYKKYEGDWFYFTHDPRYCMARVSRENGKFSPCDLKEKIHRSGI